MSRAPLPPHGTSSRVTVERLLSTYSMIFPCASEWRAEAVFLLYVLLLTCIAGLLTECLLLKLPLHSWLDFAKDTERIGGKSAEWQSPAEVAFLNFWDLFLVLTQCTV